MWKYLCKWQAKQYHSPYTWGFHSTTFIDQCNSKACYFYILIRQYTRYCRLNHEHCKFSQCFTRPNLRWASNSTNLECDFNFWRYSSRCCNTTTSENQNFGKSVHWFKYLVAAAGGTIILKDFNRVCNIATGVLKTQNSNVYTAVDWRLFDIYGYLHWEVPRTSSPSLKILLFH